MQKAKTSPPSRRIGVLLFDQFSNHCLANAVEPLRAANGIAGRPLFGWQFLTLDGRPVVSSSGLPVTPHGALRDAAGDELFVVSSYGHRKQMTPSALRGLAAAARRFETVVGMDTGAWLMAAAGLLDRRCATIHWDELTAFAEAFPDVEVREDRFVIDGDRVTCGGVTTTFDLILHMIDERHGSMLRLEVAALFMHGERSQLSEPGVRMTGAQKLDAAAALMRRNIEVPLSVDRIARQVGLSRRGLEVLFVRATGTSPAAVYRAIRLREARRLVEQTTHGIAEIATRSGYQDASAMTRAFRREFGTTPRRIRNG